MLLTDAGVTTLCNFSRMTGLIQNAAEVARLVLEKPRPRVALLSANEKVIESLASTKLEAALTRKYWADMTVYGPLSLDLAIDPESVKIKGFSRTDDPAMREVAGRADVLVCHMGLTTKGSIGAVTAKTLDQCVELIDDWAEAARKVRPEVLVLCHGGPIAEPEDAAYVLQRCRCCHGFYGASSMERLPTERAIKGQTEAFVSIRF